MVSVRISTERCRHQEEPSPPSSTARVSSAVGNRSLRSFFMRRATTSSKKGDTWGFTSLSGRASSVSCRWITAAMLSSLKGLSPLASSYSVKPSE